jgi:hypothetical protein
MRKSNKGHHQAAAIQARCAGMLRDFQGHGGYANNGVSRNAVRAADAEDQIAEAMAEQAEKRRQRQKGG